LIGRGGGGELGGNNIDVVEEEEEGDAEEVAREKNTSIHLRLEKL
jgi:hypothetical protein